MTCLLVNCNCFLKTYQDDSDDSDEENNGSTEETNDADRKNTDKELDQHHKTFSDVDEDSAATPPLSIEEQRAELVFSFVISSQQTV